MVVLGRTSRRTALVVLLVVLVAAVLVGSLVPLASAQRPAPELGGELRSWLEEHGPLRVGWSAALQPVSVVEDGEVTGGYAVDAWDLAAIRLGVELEHVAYPDTRSLGAALDAGEVEVAGAVGFHPAVAERREANKRRWVSMTSPVGRSRRSPAP